MSEQPTTQPTAAELAEKAAVGILAQLTHGLISKDRLVNAILIETGLANLLKDRNELEQKYIELKGYLSGDHSDSLYIFERSERCRKAEQERDAILVENKKLVEEMEAWKAGCLRNADNLREAHLLSDEHRREIITLQAANEELVKERERLMACLMKSNYTEMCKVADQRDTLLAAIIAARKETK